jgi:GT2 family glycosyltransferase
VILSIVSGTVWRIHYLRRMVYSVREQIPPGISYEIVLVGLSSDEETKQWVREQRDIVWLEHDELVGAIKAFGDGAARAQGDYVVLANDDLTFLPGSIMRALVFMQDRPNVGIGLFYTDRSQYRGNLHVAQMPAYYEDGRPTSIPYGGICIVPRTLGNTLGWWNVPGARTYGGDNALCARAVEAGYDIAAIPDAAVHETIPNDH